MTWFLPIPGLKTGVQSNIFWSEIGSWFEKPGGNNHQELPGVPWGLVQRTANWIQYGGGSDISWPAETIKWTQNCKADSTTFGLVNYLVRH